jgi:hypothetical protein
LTRVDIPVLAPVRERALPERHYAARGDPHRRARAPGPRCIRSKPELIHCRMMRRPGPT